MPLNRAERTVRELDHRIQSKATAAVSVLDVGCGFGETAQLLLDHGYQVIGLDLSEEAISRAQQRAPAAQLLVGSAYRLPFEDSRFAAVVSLDVLEHLEQPEVAIAEMVRVLQPGGWLIITVPHAGWSGWLDPANWQARLRGHRPDHRHFSPAQLIKLLGPAVRPNTIERRGLGLSQLLRLLTRPIRVLATPNRRDQIEQWLGRVEALEYQWQTGIAGYHLFVAVQKYNG